VKLYQINSISYIVYHIDANFLEETLIKLKTLFIEAVQ